MADTIRVVELIFKIIKNPKLKFFFIPISWLLMPLYKLFCRIPFIQIAKITFEIEKLESQKKFYEARNLRRTWLENPKFSLSAELLLSEANDLQYNQKNSSHALKLYEKAISINPYYNPIDMYYGASCASILAGNKLKAKKYYFIFVEWFERFSKDPKLKSFTENKYSGCKKWLEEKININPNTYNDES